MNIREVELNDLNEIQRLQREWREENITIGFRGDENDLLPQYLGAYFLLAELGQEVIGYILCEKKQGERSVINENGESFLEINDLYVQKGFRGRSIGKKLIEEIQSRAKKDGIKQIQLYSSNRDVKKTIKFYETNGFCNWYIRMYKNLD